jgi:hypothetical protein
MTLFRRIRNTSPLVLLFNVFCLIFAGFMALDYLEVKFDFLGLTWLRLAGISILLAVVTFIAHKFYKPNNH